MWEVREVAVLFDSAIPGAELEPDERLILDLKPGEYRVRATYMKWLTVMVSGTAPAEGYA
ncbi:Imm21 family immunity protein [Nonomuraea sp. NPDC003709]|uniref:Imm21 family immunity protein n=1 Tax=Nonomuraea sp. NPDC003709 TaxID=3154450 RepID=UPI0033A206EC